MFKLHFYCGLFLCVCVFAMKFSLNLVFHLCLLNQKHGGGGEIGHVKVHYTLLITSFYLQFRQGLLV